MLITKIDRVYDGNLIWCQFWRLYHPEHEATPQSNQPKYESMELDRLLLEDSAETKRAAEINNALAVILGNAQLLLLKDTVAPEDRDRLKAIEQSSFRIHGLVEGMIRSKKPTSF